jgi:hypothetical protein
MAANISRMSECIGDLLLFYHLVVIMRLARSSKQSSCIYKIVHVLLVLLEGLRYRDPSIVLEHTQLTLTLQTCIM